MAEEELSGDIGLREICKQNGLTGVRELRDHGWRDQPGLIYGLIQEREADRMHDIWNNATDP